MTFHCLLWRSVWQASASISTTASWAKPACSRPSACPPAPAQISREVSSPTPPPVLPPRNVLTADSARRAGQPRPNTPTCGHGNLRPDGSAESPRAKGAGDGEAGGAPGASGKTLLGAGQVRELGEPVRETFRAGVDLVGDLEQPGIGF